VTRKPSRLAAENAWSSAANAESDLNDFNPRVARSVT
jgi:hypothetical protein